MIVWKKLWYLFVLLCIASTLINTKHFGEPVIAAFILFTGLTSIATVIVFAYQIFVKQKYISGMPLYIKIFALLACYIFFHGLFSGYMGLAHYYWFAYGLLFCTTYFVARHPVANSKSVSQGNYVPFLFWGVVILALAENLLIFLQLLGLLRPPNEFFTATGSSINPNVTAMFLAVSLSAMVWLIKNSAQRRGKLLASVALILTVAAIGVLKCRSAYLFIGILLVAEILPICVKIYRRQLKPTIWMLVASLLVVAVIIAAGVVFVEKKTSALNRVGIWETSAKMLFKKPLQGFGIGAYEKDYNLFAAEKKNAVNDYVGMAYNDFLELGIEGGIPAMLLWIFFLCCVFFYYRKHKENTFILPLLIGFILMQLSNFVFQALPVMALFIVYLAALPHLKPHTNETIDINNIMRSKKDSAFSIALIIVGCILTFNTIKLGYGFYETAQINKNMQGPSSIQAYSNLEKYVNGQPFYHKTFGNAYLQANDIPNAKKQYLLALKHSSEENILDNCGYCYQIEKRYDSSEYYYNVLRDMAPHKFGPRFRLLKLFEQTSDTARLLQTAKEIDSMPIKVGGQQVDYIKQYAQLVLKLKTNQ